MNVYTRPDGAVVSLWPSTCNDCGFVTGIAIVQWPDGQGRMLTGAGCFVKPKRRGVAEAKEWADTATKPGVPCPSSP